MTALLIGRAGVGDGVNTDWRSPLDGIGTGNRLCAELGRVEAAGLAGVSDIAGGGGGG